MNKIKLIVTTVFLVLLCLISCSKTEEDPKQGGPLEEDSLISYTFENGVLTLTGTGAMPEYDYGSNRPWNDFSDEITKVVVSDGITNVGNYAFYDLENLTNVELGKDVSSIGNSSFDICRKLESYVIAEGNATYSSEDGILFNSDKSILLSCPEANALTDYIVPETVVEISSFAFDSCDNLVSVELPPSVVTIGNSAFSSCSSLTKITLNNGLKTIGKSAFMTDRKLSSMMIPATVTSIGESAFDEIGVTSIDVAEESEYFTSLNGILYSKDMTTLLAYPNGLEQVTFSIPEGVTTIGRYAVTDAKVTEVIFPSSVTTIERGAFMSSNVARVVFNDGLKVIEPNAFAYCDELTSIELPASVIQVEDDAFSSCDELISITINGESTSIGEILGSLSGFLAPENIESIKIYGYSGSSAENYAVSNDLAFVSIGTASSANVVASEAEDEDDYGLFDSLSGALNEAKDIVTDATSTMADSLGDFSDSVSSAYEDLGMDDVMNDMSSTFSGIFGESESEHDSSSSNSSNLMNSSISLPSEPAESSAKVNMRIPRWLRDTSWISTNGVEYCKIDNSDIYFYDAYVGWISMKDVINSAMSSLGDIAKLQIQEDKNSSYIALVYNKDTGIGLKVLELNNFKDGQFDAYMSGTLVGTFNQFAGDFVEVSSKSSNDLFGGMF